MIPLVPRDRNRGVSFMTATRSRQRGLMFEQMCMWLHQVATDALTAMDKAMSRDGIRTNDRYDETPLSLPVI